MNTLQLSQQQMSEIASRVVHKDFMRVWAMNASLFAPCNRSVLIEQRLNGSE